MLTVNLNISTMFTKKIIGGTLLKGIYSLLVCHFPTQLGCLEWNEPWIAGWLAIAFLSGITDSTLSALYTLNHRKIGIQRIKDEIFCFEVFPWPYTVTEPLGSVAVHDTSYQRLCN